MKKPSKNTKKTDSSNFDEGVVVGVAAAAAAFAGYYLFGPKGKENRAKIKGWTLKAKGEVLERIEKLEEVSEEKYHAIVDSVMNKYKKLKHTTEEETDKLEKELKKRFKDVARDMKGKKKTATKKVAKARTVAAKKIAPKKTTKKVTKKTTKK